MDSLPAVLYGGGCTVRKQIASGYPASGTVHDFKIYTASSICGFKIIYPGGVDIGREGVGCTSFQSNILIHTAHTTICRRCHIYKGFNSSCAIPSCFSGLYYGVVSGTVGFYSCPMIRCTGKAVVRLQAAGYQQIDPVLTGLCIPFKLCSQSVPSRCSVTWWICIVIFALLLYWGYSLSCSVLQQHLLLYNHPGRWEVL